MRRGGILLTLWLAVAGSAIAIGTWALSLVGGEINDSTVAPLSNAAIDAMLDTGSGQRGASQAPGGTVNTGTPGGTPSGTPGATATGRRVGLTVRGGSVVAQCQAGNVFLVTWTAAQGYRADDDVVRGPAPVARLEFESDTVEDVTATVRCVQGSPVMRATSEPDDHGGSSPTATATTQTSEPGDDHGSGGHGSDDGPGDDHHQRGKDDD